jgi:hypothetical protein
VRLDDDEVAALDELGRWLVGVPEQPPLGARIQQAIESESPTSFGGRAIGPHQWALPLREQVDEMLGSLARLREGWRDAAKAGVEIGTGMEMELEEEAELGDFFGGRYDRDDDAPSATIRDRDSIGELPITIEEESPAVEPEPELVALGDEDESLEGALDTMDDAPTEDEEPDRLERFTRSLLGKRKKVDRSPAMARPAAATRSPSPLTCYVTRYPIRPILNFRAPCMLIFMMIPPK